MRPIRYTYTPSIADLVRFASNVTGAIWTLIFTTTSDTLAHKITIRNDSATNHSDKTALLTGTDVFGRLQTETLNLPGPSLTATSTKYFKTLVSVVPSASIGVDTMDIGQDSSFSSVIIPLSWREGIVSINLDIVGTANLTVQQTFDDVQDPVNFNYAWQDSPSTRLVNATTSTNDSYQGIPTAIRLIANSFTAGASISITVIARNL